MLKTISNALEKFSTEHKLLKKYEKQADKILKKIDELENSSDDKLKDIYENNKQNMDITEAMAVICIAAKKTLDLTPYKVQIIGALGIFNNNFIEMKTGEGKTLVATLASVLIALKYKKLFIVTVNDYLAERDEQQMKPIFEFFEITTNVVKTDSEIDEKDEIYGSNIIYGTNSTFAFDYLKDNLTMNMHEIFQSDLSFAIVDEADSILIDEARTPLIISGPAEHNEEFFFKSFYVASQLEKAHYEIDLENKSVLFTEEGIQKIEELLNISNLYINENSALAHQIQQSLKAIYTLRKDVDYVISEENEVKIVDEFNGRILKDTRFGGGLHQAIEVKEGIEIKEENENLAQITYQNYFNMFDNLAGMSGTISTEKKEFKEIYDKFIITIPTNLPIQRKDENDKLFVTVDDKLTYLVERVKEKHQAGMPILIGTLHIEQSEKIAKELEKIGYRFNMLNAKNHFNEAEIIKNAGNKKAITIATNMAGRGVDIKLSQEVLDLGGLYVLGFERYQNRRIDNQLIGRSGRQGNPGETEFLLSLEDEILAFSSNNFLYEKLKKEIEDSDEVVSLDLLTAIVQKQQKKIEGLHFEGRKSMHKYNIILSKQRELIYRMRKEILNIEEDEFSVLEDKVFTYIDEVINKVNLNTNSENEFKKDVLKQLEIDLSDEKDFNLKEFDLKEYIYQKIQKNLSQDTILKYDTKNIFLENLDRNWRTFLNKAESIKSGAHHRGLSQKDPLIEYQLELEKRFNYLILTIKKDILKEIFLFEEIEHKFEDKDELVLSNTMKEIQDSFSLFIENIEKDIITPTELLQNFAEEIIDKVLFDKPYEQLQKDPSSFKEFSDFFQLKSSEIFSFFGENNMLESRTYVLELLLNKIFNNLNEISEDNDAVIKSVIMHFTFQNINFFNEELHKILGDYIDNSTYNRIENLFVMTHLHIKFDSLGNLISLKKEHKKES